jgi:hypothetical protein
VRVSSCASRGAPRGRARLRLPVEAQPAAAGSGAADGELQALRVLTIPQSPVGSHGRVCRVLQSIAGAYEVLAYPGSDGSEAYTTGDSANAYAAKEASVCRARTRVRGQVGGGSHRAGRERTRDDEEADDGDEAEPWYAHGDIMVGYGPQRNTNRVHINSKPAHLGPWVQTPRVAWRDADRGLRRVSISTMSARSNAPAVPSASVRA